MNRLSCSLLLAFLLGCHGADEPLPGRSDASTQPRDASRAPSDAAMASPREPIALESCEASALSSEQLRALQEGGDPEALRVIYPYAGTVFPRGLAAPLVMWDGIERADAVSLTLRSTTFSYRGCFALNGEGRVAVPQEAWDRAGAQTVGKSDPFTLELSVLVGDRAYGPVREQIIIAPASLHGSVFYNSYSSDLARAAGAQGGAILRIPAGGTAEVFLGQRTCVGSHGASADGTRLVTNEGIYALTPDTPVNPEPLRRSNGELEFPGVSANGDVYAVKGQLFASDQGSTINGGLPTAANEASFSASGRWLAFMEGGPGPRAGSGVPVTIPGLGGLIPGLGGSSDQGAIGSGTSAGQGKLAIMRFDGQARRLSDRRLFADVSASAQWPVFLPDDAAVVFTDTRTHDLMLLDLASSTVTPLARAMGFASLDDARAGRSYLPFASEGEGRQAFYPTVAPVAAGGYFWIYFDSPRRYGNMDTSKIPSGLQVPAGITFVADALGALDTSSRQLWVAAIEISPRGDYRNDPSAPAFFLPGQELGANNHRAFSALDPCLDQGSACESGTRCCSGFCSDGACIAPPDRCAQSEEACETSDDCCEPTDRCIGGFCSLIVVQ
jgi:hypothetical protein